MSETQAQQGVQFFGEEDRMKDGRIRSEYPSWYNEQQVDELKESVSSRERMIERGDIHPDVRAQTLSEIARDKLLLEHIEKAKPKFSDVQKDSVHKAYKVLGTEIGMSMFTYSDMQRGTADAHEEANRMVDPCIPVKKEFSEYLSACGIKPRGGKISRNEAARVYKIMGRSLGENSNIEKLRMQK